MKYTINTVRNILKLIRFPNILIVAGTQLFLYYFVLRPVFLENNIPGDLRETQFWLLVVVTVLIAASGYIINDIMDYSSDMVNKPHKVIIHQRISEQNAYWLYFCSLLVGFTLSLYVDFLKNTILLIWVFPSFVVSLFYYSAYLKKQPLLGNILIAFFCAAVAAIVWYAEKEALNTLLVRSREVWWRIAHIFVWYTIFAFLVTFFRELVKDLQDMEGDKIRLSQTAPLLWGIQPSKRIGYVLGMLLSIFIVYWMYVLREQLQVVGFVVLLFGVMIPLLLSMVWLEKAQSSKEYGNLSMLLKYIMLAGIFVLPFIKY